MRGVSVTRNGIFRFYETYGTYSYVRSRSGYSGGARTWSSMNEFSTAKSQDGRNDTAFPALSRTDKYFGARTVQILQPSFDRFSLSMASTGCRHGATARPDLDKIDQLSRCSAYKMCSYVEPAS